MAKSETADPHPNEFVLSPRDILFECPACSKSLVVDEAAEGMIVKCPQCRIDVIVPPKPATAMAPPSPSEIVAKPTAEPKTVAAPEADKPAAEGDDLRGRLVTIANKLKELQTQRTEINSRLATRINDINRDLVMMARLETSHQQVLAEFNQIVGQIGTHAASASPTTTAAGRTRVNLRS